MLVMAGGNILISDAEMVLPDGIVSGDLRIENGVITEISTNGKLIHKDNEIHYDAKGMHLLPGGIDPQVHFREPGDEIKEDLETGSAAAASGGITSFLDMPNNNPSATSLD